MQTVNLCWFQKMARMGWRTSIEALTEPEYIYIWLLGNNSIIRNIHFTVSMLFKLGEFKVFLHLLEFSEFDQHADFPGLVPTM
jgi:hypothetical protein